MSNVWRHCQPVYQRDCVNFAFPPIVNECSSCTIFLAILNQVCFLKKFSQLYVYRGISLGFNCIPLMINKFEHFMCLFVTLISFLVKCLFKSFVYFKDCISCFLIKLAMYTESIMYTSPSSEGWFVNISSYSMACLFVILMILQRKKF